MQGQYNLEDPEQFLFLQDTVSPTFTAGTHLKAAAQALNKEPLSALKYPPIRVFHAQDPDEDEAQVLTFSLDTRRLLTFRMAKVHQVNTKPANIREIRQECWKMTSESGGYITPQMTSTPNKEGYPAQYTTLFKLRTDLERVQAQAAQHCQAHHIVGEAREAYLDQQVQAQVVPKFNLN